MPDSQRKQLAPYIAECAATASEFRWTPVENLHLTVRFIGSVERATVDQIAARLDELQLPGFNLELGDVGTFKRGRLARVVWLQVQAGADQAGLLAARVEAECVRAGLEPEARAFQPHVTLARARPRDGAALPLLPAPPELPSWRAERLVLYSSHLGRAGAVYEQLRAIRLS